jgi:hypothetical protein
MYRLPVVAPVLRFAVLGLAVCTACRSDVPTAVVRSGAARLPNPWQSTLSDDSVIIVSPWFVLDLARMTCVPIVLDSVELATLSDGHVYVTGWRRLGRGTSVALDVDIRGRQQADEVIGLGDNPRICHSALGVFWTSGTCGYSHDYGRYEILSDSGSVATISDCIVDLDCSETAVAWMNSRGAVYEWSASRTVIERMPPSIDQAARGSLKIGGPTVCRLLRSSLQCVGGSRGVVDMGEIAAFDVTSEGKVFVLVRDQSMTSVRLASMREDGVPVMSGPPIALEDCATARVYVSVATTRFLVQVRSSVMAECNFDLVLTRSTNPD